MTKMISILATSLFAAAFAWSAHGQDSGAIPAGIEKLHKDDITATIAREEENRAIIMHLCICAGCIEQWTVGHGNAQKPLPKCLSPEELTLASNGLVRRHNLNVRPGLLRRLIPLTQGQLYVVSEAGRA